MGASSDVKVMPGYESEPLAITAKVNKLNLTKYIWGGGMLFVGIAMSLPFLWMVSTALMPLKEVFVYPPHFVTLHPQWGNWIKAWNYRPMGQYLFNTVIVAGFIVLGQVTTASLAAYALARLRFRGMKFVFWTIMMTLMVPTQVTFIPLFLIIKDAGWMDSYTGLIAPFVGSAFATFWLYQAFKQVPSSIVEAAQVDGAGHFWILYKIMLPLSKASIITLVLLNFVWHYNDFFWPLIVTQSDAMRTIPVGLSFMMASDGTGTPWNLLAAANLISMVPSLLLFLFGKKYFTGSAMSSAVKG
jgi:ABC-type glycerol-3-phosphate transport system permease component